MNRKIILFALLLIYQYLLITTEDECSTFFESRKSTQCTDITLNTTHQCLYSNNKCYAFYKSCSSYTVGTGQKIDSKICSSIEASSADRICKVNEQGNECVEDYRECKDYNGKTLCPSLRAGTNQRCILFNGKCESHYEKCEYITDKDKCGANIPAPSEYSNRYSKCFWDTTTDPSNPSCKPTDRTCSEYDTYKQFINCQDLKPKDTKKKCIYDRKKNKCYEGDGDCNIYEGNNRGDCQKYKHIDSNNELLPLYKCDFNDDNECVDSLKRCSDYKEGEDDGNCESFKTDNSAITKCVLEDKKCKEKYVSCEAYNLDVDKKLETDCQAIKPLITGTTSINNDVKCVMESNVCTEKNKECSEMTETTCEGHSLVGKPNKKCVLKDKKCIEQYKSCDIYNSNVEEDKKNEKDCTSIEDPSGLKCVFMNKNCIVEYTSCYNYNTEVDNDKKNEKDCTSIVESGLRCVFTPKSGETPAKCESKNYECSDLNFDTLKSNCINHNIYSNTQECTYNKGVCTKTAKKCKNVKIDINETDKSKEGICNSAPTEGSNKICTLNKDKDGCIEQDKPKQSESSSQGNDDNSGNEKYLNKILIFILCLLL